MQTPSITFVIPLYNKQDEVSVSLTSLEKQTDQSFDVLVVDDGSTDNSYNIALSHKSFFQERLTLMRKSNGGVSSARNSGFHNASGDFVSLLDADDQVSADYVKKMKALIRDFPDAGMYCFNFAHLKNGSIVPMKQKCVPRRGYVPLFFKSISRNPKSGLTSQSSICVKKSVWKDVGGYVEGVTHTEDTDFCCKVALKSKVVFEDYVGAIYNLDASNRTSSGKPLLERHVNVELKRHIEECQGVPKLQKYIKSFIFKNYVHMAYNNFQAGFYQGAIHSLHKGKDYFFQGSVYYKAIYFLIYCSAKIKGGMKC